MELPAAPVIIGAFLILFGSMFALTVAVFMACCCLKHRFNDGRVIQGTELPDEIPRPRQVPRRIAPGPEPSPLQVTPTAPPIPPHTPYTSHTRHTILVIQPDEDETLALGIK